MVESGSVQVHVSVQQTLILLTFYLPSSPLWMRVLALFKDQNCFGLLSNKFSLSGQTALHVI